MAEDLLSMLPDGAQAAEDESRLAGNMQDAPVVDTAGSRDNPGGSTPTGGATDNTITEQAPESQPPAVGVTQDIPEPETDVGGGSGGLAGGATTIENPDQPRVVQTGVAQDDPALSPLTPLAAAEEANRPPTVTVLPENPAEPSDGDGDPGNDDDNFNAGLRNDPLVQLAPGLVSEVGLENGLSQFATTQGTIVIGDPDGIGDIATVLIAGQLFTLSQLLTIDPLSPSFQIPLEAGDGDTETEGVLTLQGFDPVTGAISFTFTLTSPVNNTNPLGNPNIDQNSALVPISATVTDLSGATATATGGIRIVDATPFVLASGEEPVLTVDETVLATNATQNFAGNFSSAFGADAAGSLTYAVVTAGGASGLVDTATGEVVNLINNGGVIEGRTAGSNDLVFTVTVNSGTGEVTLDQIRAVVHPTLDPNEPKSLSADNLVTVTATITDKDGDTQNASLNIGTNLVFLDDGPSISVNAATEPVLTVDETVLATNATQNFAGNFSSAFGADAAGSLTYAVVTAGGASGLVDTATGEVVNLINNGGVIEGRTAGSNDLVFTVTVNSGTGEVTLDQIRAVVHPTLDPNEPKSLSADNLVTVTATITDKDGDTQNASLNIGSNLVFLDDGPSISVNAATEPVLTVDETVLATNATQNFAGNFSSAFGADAAGSLTYAVVTAGGASGLVDTATGEVVNLINNGGVIEGRTAGSNDLVFTVTVNSGTGEVTLDQIRAVVHPTLDPNEPKSLSADNLVTVTATITDKDGDTQNASLNIGSNLVFLDDGPSISVNAATEPVLTVDETVLATNATQNFAGNFSSAFGADAAGSLTYAVVTAGGASGLVDTATGEVVNLINNGGVIEGRTAGSNDLVFTVTVNSGTGEVTLDQIRAVVHPTLDPNEPKSLSADNLVTVTATITDKDGDTQNASLNIGTNLVFLDDGPSISVNAATEPVLTVDETVLATNATQNFAGNFSSAFGADAAGSLTYAVVTAGGASGLVDTATGEVVNLINNGGVIEGRTAGSNDLVFTVTVNSGTGEVTLDQIRAVVHPTLDPNEPKSLSADNLVTVTATITDKDGDTQNASLNIGSNLVFLDDGPSISVNAATEPVLTVDETVLATNATQNFAGNFSSAFGADAAGSLTYAVVTAGGASGLVDTATGEVVNLINNGGVIEGRTAGSNDLVFTVTVNSGTGEVTLDQIRAVVHPTLDPNEPKSLSADNLVTVTATITDKDGDTQNASLNIGTNLVFLDDGPSISVNAATEPVLTVDETVLATNATQNFAGNFSSAFGADAAGSLTYAVVTAGGASGLVDTATGEVVNLINNGGVIEGRTAGSNDLVFTVTVNSGTGEVTLDQIRAVVHPTLDPNEPKSLSADNLVTVTATITDKDGDTQNASLNIGTNLVFLDDGPSISVNAATEPVLTVDETVLATNATQNFAGNFSSAFGADAAGSLTYAVVTAGGASGLVDTATGEVVNLINNGGVIEGRTAGSNDLVFTVTVNSGTGEVTLDQIRAVVHPTLDPNEPKSLSADNLVTVTATITDKDGDTQNASLNIGTNLVFLDDGPSISVNAATEPVLTVDETVLATNATQNFAGNFSSAFGADAAGSLTYAVVTAGGASGLVDTATGEVVNLINNGGVIEGRTAGSNDLVFTVTVNSGTGEVTLDQIRAVVHPTLDPNEPKSLSADNLVTVTATITDKDGDTQNASLNIGSNLVFLDDGPSISVNAATEPVLTVDETVLATNATQNFAGNFSSAFGADAAGSLTYAVVTAGGASGLVDTATGEVVNLINNGGVIEGRTAGSNDLVFTVTVNSGTGEVTLDQIRAVVHPTLDPNEPKSLSADNLVTVTATITDKDGDTQNASLNIGSNLVFLDDGPSISVNAATEPVLTVDETVLATNATQNFAGNFSSAFGADAAGSLTYAVVTAGGASGLVDTATGEVVNLINNGGVIEGRTAGSNDLVFTVTVNSGTGEVTLDQIRAVVHPTLDPNEPKSLSADNLVTVTATITDKDGDTQNASLNIGTNLVFLDDGPLVQSSNSTSTVIIDAPYTPTPGSPIVYNNVNIGNWIFGADGPSGSQSVTLTGLPAGYTATTPVVSGSLITFSLSYQGTKVADFEINSANGNDDKLTIYQVPGQIVTSNIDGDSAKAGGPGIYYVELVAADIVAVVTGINPDGTAGSVNASNQGWAGGDGDQNMEDGERITFAFKDYDPTLPNNTGGNDFVQSFSFDAQKFTGGGNNPTLSITVTYSDGSTHTFANVTVPNGLTTYPFSVDTTGLYVNGVLAQAYASSAAGIQSVDILDVVDGSQTFNINGVKIGSISDVRPDLNPTFTLTLKDGDGDTSSLSVNLKLDGNDVGGPTVLGITTSPIALDANNDGQIIYQALATSSAHFDYAGDGFAEQTAWIAAGDALLVYDHNSDRVANDGSEIAFIQYHPDARTDLEGLRLAFDSNYDGVFDVNDAKFADFGIWTDFNADAIADPGEFKTLIEAGIASINLTSDGQVVSAADGDVLVHGSTTYSYADGTTGLAQDVTFAALLASSGSASEPTPGSGSEPVYPVAESLEPATDTFTQDVVVPAEEAIEAGSIAVADLLDQFMVENTVRDSTVVEYQQEFMLTADDSIDDFNLDPSFTEPTAEAIAALDEADFIPSDDVAAGLDHAADVVDDFSYTV